MIKIFTRIAIALFFCATAAAQTASTGQEKSQQPNQLTEKSLNSKAQRDKNQPVAVYTTVSVVETTGCWATLYSQENFLGESIDLLASPGSEDLNFAKFSEWKNRVNSVAVGPKAQLFLYGDENYRDLDHTYPADTYENEVRKRPWFDDIQAVTLNCLN